MRMKTLTAAWLAVALALPAAVQAQATHQDLKGSPPGGPKHVPAKPPGQKATRTEGDAKPLAVRPEQSSAERTADPQPLKHDEPTGETTRQTKR